MVSFAFRKKYVCVSESDTYNTFSAIIISITKLLIGLKCKINARIFQKSYFKGHCKIYFNLEKKSRSESSIISFGNDAVLRDLIAIVIETVKKRSKEIRETFEVIANKKNRNKNLKLWGPINCCVCLIYLL